MKEKEELRERKVALEVEWKAIMEERHKSMKKWEEQCRILKQLGEKKKDWPKKPTHMSKKELTALRLGNDSLSSQHATQTEADEADENNAEERSGFRDENGGDESD
ncbi:hypothetical protein K435DRAFT_864468 [Dendrothele bispora CBS 962.96]|uniref:Uncharacterized protein n=1 Tax=Dendrothele bispora (strain CBS 962.96) TaxID=1314807 RepID=A0A4S8LMG7_DENBC|nr:hypothetical protein K435DRAFT_864468 [Dendrothele bispora CBS 962.96]